MMGQSSFSLRELLCHLGSADLHGSDWNHYEHDDAATGDSYVAEVRAGAKFADIVCETSRVSPDGWREPICFLRAKPDDGAWSVHSFRVTGRPVTADPEDALMFAWKMMAEVAVGRAPDTNAILSRHLGLTLPIVGYR